MFALEKEYLSFLVANDDINEGSRKSYRSYINGVQRHLEIKVNSRNLSSEEDVIRLIAALTKRNRVSIKTIQNYGSAMRQYVAMIMYMNK